MLELKNVSKQYDRFTLNCDMEVKAGTITALIGKNGAGKTTTFKAILDLISLDGGTVTIFDKNHTDIVQADKEDIGVVLSNSGFSEYLNIKDVYRIMKGMYQNFEATYFLDKCKEFELPMQKRIKEFSTGMKAKLKIICAMSHHARLLILDEPTAGLDVIARDELLDMLREFMVKNENASILISSHISSDLEGLCDDLYLIDYGKVVLHEEMDTLLSEYGVLKVHEQDYDTLDKQYILKTKKESYGYCCLTNQKQFYIENHPSLTIEKANVDDIMLLMVKGE